MDRHPSCAVFDRRGYASLLSLLAPQEEEGGKGSEIWRSPSFPQGLDTTIDRVRRREGVSERAVRFVEKGKDRKKFASIAIGSGFTRDALAPLKEAVQCALSALLALDGLNESRSGDPAYIQEKLVAGGGIPKSLLPPLFLALGLRNDSELSPSEAAKVAEAAEALLELAHQKTFSRTSF